MDKKDKEKLVELLKEVKGDCKKIASEISGCYYCDVKDICKIWTYERIPENWEFPNSNRKWRAERGGNYWYVSPLATLIDSREDGDSVDDILYYSHNYFRTKKEAEKYAKVLETEMLLKKFAETHNNNELVWSDASQLKWYLTYYAVGCYVGISSQYTGKTARTIYFTSDEVAKQAIAEIGEDKIKEYLTYEW